MNYVQGQPIRIDIEGFPIPYFTPPLPPLKEIKGHELPKKDQKWRREIFPSDEEADLLPVEKKLALIEEDFRRRLFGYWFMNNGEPTYITGSNYFTLTHWYMAAVNDDGYPDYRKAARDWFYITDICDNDIHCAGCIMMTQKRFGKTEYALADLYNKATLIDENCLFGLQSLTSTEAKNNLFKGRIMRSHKRIPNYLKPVSNETNSKKEIVGELTFMGENLGGGKYKAGLNNVIDHRPTLVSAYQGKRPKRIFLDEPGSVEEMDIEDWWTTVKQQLALGKKFFGKAYLPTTLETMKPKGAPLFKKIWEDSDPLDKDENGRTKSGLYRYFKPQYLGREDFIDEYGNDLIEEAKKFRQNELDNATPDGKRKIKRQYPETVEEAFDIDFGGGLEADCIEILKARLLELRRDKPPIYRATLYEFNGELTFKYTEIAKPDREIDDPVVRIFEQPRKGVLYRIGVDGTATDKETSNVQNKKSKYSVTVTKLFDPDVENGKSYCDVAEYVIRPERMEECYRVTVLLTKLYNIDNKARILPEGNAGNAAPIVSFFRNNGALQLMLKQPKYAGSDSTEELDRYCFYRDNNVRRTQLDLLNIAVRMYGHNLNSERLILDLIKIGTGNTDLADSFQAAILSWGGFYQPKKPQVKKKPPIRHRFDPALGRYVVDIPDEYLAEYEDLKNKR